jgi:DNA-binding Lrp family transcriptional regulator
VDYLLESALEHRALEVAITFLSPVRRASIERAMASMSLTLLTPAEIGRARQKRDELAERYEAMSRIERLYFSGFPRSAERAKRLQLPPGFRPPRAVPDYALRSQVLDSHVHELERSTVFESQWSAAAIFSECDDVVLSAIQGREERDEALVFPYFLPGKEHAELLRIKRMAGGRRYSGRADTQTGIYFAPEMRVEQGAPLRDRGRILLWVEGEKKALALARLGYAVVGLPGVTTAHDVPHRRTTKEYRLHEWVRSHVAVDDREHIVVFDPDIRTNTQVQKAHKCLVAMLWAAGASTVRAVQWPRDVDPEVGGIDDYARFSGDDAAHELIANATEVLTGAIILPSLVIADPCIGAPTKLTYGALFAAADPLGVVTGLSMGKLGASMGRSARTVSDRVSSLEEAGYLTRTPGKRELRRKGWRADPDTYNLTHFAAHSSTPRVQIRGVLRRSHEQAIVLAVLPMDGTPIRTHELGTLTGTKPRALRYVLSELELAGAIGRSHGKVARAVASLSAPRNGKILPIMGSGYVPNYAPTTSGPVYQLTARCALPMPEPKYRAPPPRSQPWLGAVVARGCLRARCASAGPWSKLQQLTS